MPRAVPNKKNRVKLTPAQAAQAQSAIKNFLPGIPWPPVTAAAKAQMQAAVAAFTAKVNQTRRTSAKQISSGVSGTGTPLPPAYQAAAQNPQTLPAVQLAVQQNYIGVSGMTQAPATPMVSGGPVQTQTTPSVSLPVLPPLPTFLPAGTDLNTTTFASAIDTMQATVVALEQFASNPAIVAVGGGVKGSDAVNVRDK